MEPVPSSTAYDAFEDVRTLFTDQHQLQSEWQEFGNAFPALQDYVEDECEAEFKRNEAVALKTAVLGCWRAMDDFYDELPVPDEQDIDESREKFYEWKQLDERRAEDPELESEDKIREKLDELYHSFPQQELMQSASTFLTNATNQDGIRLSCVPHQMWVVRTVIDALNPSDEVEPFFQQDQEMSELFIIAAEYFNYSYANYRDHLGIGNARYERLMPEETKTMIKALEDDWSNERTAREIEALDPEDVPAQKERIQEALDIVRAENPAESFREGVRQSIEFALENGLETDEDVQELVGQICYRAADLGFLLDREGASLSDYSKELREE